MNTVANLMADGLLRAVAASLASDSHPTAQFYELEKRCWKRWGYLVDSDFWSAGTRELFRDEHSGPAFRAYRVRLDPEGVRQHLPVDQPKSEPEGAPEPAVKTPPPKADSRPKIDRKLLRTWIEAHSANYPGSPFWRIRDDARTAHPQFRVSELAVKDGIAELKLTLKPGNPTILRK